MRLTIKTTEGIKLPDGKRDHIVFDDDIPGFGIRLREGGSRTWIYQYRIGSKQRRMVLGAAKSVPIALARENAGKLEAKVKLGGDPAMDKDIARRNVDNTFAALAEQYLEARKSEWRPRTAYELKRHFRKHAKPLHRMPITSIGQRDVAILLGNIATQSGHVASNRVRATLNTFFGWLIRQGIKLPEGNVVAYTDTREERSRDRVLSDTELKAIWAACLDDHHGAVIKLLMLTAQRRDEIAGLRWDELHDDQIVLPAERTKNNRSHLVPLSEPAKAILSKFTRTNRKHVFGRDDTGYQGVPKAQPKLVARIAAAHGKALPRWTPHDLRRTAATRMAELGVQPHVIEAVLNHVSGHKSGVAGIYNRATYDKEKREALNLWAAHLMAVIEGKRSTVVPLKRA
jgi:integrase